MSTSVRLSQIMSAQSDSLKEFHQSLVNIWPKLDNVKNTCPNTLVQGQVHTKKSNVWKLDFLSAPYLQDALKDFFRNLIQGHA